MANGKRMGFTSGTFVKQKRSIDPEEYSATTAKNAGTAGQMEADIESQEQPIKKIPNKFPRARVRDLAKYL
jgi:hypothetical protein